MRTRLLVAADGARSRMRSLARLRTVQWMYNQKGLVATVRTAEPHATAWQRFLPTGPLALLPVRDGYSNIVWSTSPAHAAELEASTSAGFVAAVNEVMAAQVAAAKGFLGQPRQENLAQMAALEVGQQLWRCHRQHCSGCMHPAICRIKHRNFHLLARVSGPADESH